MRVGYLVWEPTIIRDSRTNEIKGIYPDAIGAIAKAINVRLSWHETTLASFAAALNADQFDFFAGAVFVTIPRSVAVAYTQPVAYVGNGGVVRTSGSFRPKAIADLTKPGLRIAVLQGQALEEYCRRNLPQAELLIIAGGDLTAPLAAVSAGRADIGLMNSVTVAKYAAEHPEVTAVLTGSEQVEILPLAWATRHRDQELLSFLNSSLTYLKSTGRLEAYQKAYPTPLLYDIPALHPAR
jgi:ABC-type amino acid transport substrate-binding protein